MGHFRPLILYFRLFNTVDSQQINIWYKSLPMTGFEPRTSGVGSDCSTNWATTIVLHLLLFTLVFSSNKSWIGQGGDCLGPILVSLIWDVFIAPQFWFLLRARKHEKRKKDEPYKLEAEIISILWSCYIHFGNKIISKSFDVQLLSLSLSLSLSLYLSKQWKLNLWTCDLPGPSL